MYRLEKRVYRHERDTPSFSSTLLDKIYRSIDDGDTTNGDLKFYRETMQKKKSKGTVKCNKSRAHGKEGDEEISSLRQACLIEKWMEKKVNEKANAGRKQVFSDLGRKSHHEHDHDHDVVFFSSTSTSSDSSSGGFSSSDTESMCVTKSKSSCFVASRPKPVRASESSRSEKPVKAEKTGRTEGTMFYEQRESHMVDDYHCSSASDYTPKLHESLFRSKSRATKNYSNLKKVKQPISPGGRLANFINSLFTTSNTKKTRGTSSSIVSCDDERKLKSGQVSTCCSASSFSRSCLSKNSPSKTERLRDGVKRTVRFCPVTVIFDEDCRPCGQKRLYQEEDMSSSVSDSVAVPAVRKIRKSPSRKVEEEIKFQVMEKARRVEEMAAKFLKEYHLNQRRKDFISRDSRDNYVKEMDEDEDDAASYSSSDLFELDHLVLIGNNRYREELPVYETTHVETNRAIANGLIV
ncbi:hypothetical protein V6N13_098054 [Hibiscus sabdariffa]|uniref:Protein BIG GRAIN 1-like A n=1 Tax=Hibiscus sabdariffa TaxID=183260 RepID=A0ABR2NVG1_9ROSI